MPISPCLGSRSEAERTRMRATCWHSTGISPVISCPFLSKTNRSGDIFVVHQPHCFINDFDGLEVACTHGSPWNYDTFVPVIFAGGALKAQRIYRSIEPLEIAPTLSAVVGAKPPSGSRAAPLAEVLQRSSK